MKLPGDPPTWPIVVLFVVSFLMFNFTVISDKGWVEEVWKAVRLFLWSGFIWLMGWRFGVAVVKGESR